MNWDMIGHEWAVNLLRSHITGNQVKHAYLFTGPPGVGKRTLALRFLQAVACIDPPRDGEFCGNCRACKAISMNIHPDVHVVTAEENERSIRVDQIRALRAKLSLSPYEGERRMALIIGFHQATDQAANALLKTLEEPPSQVVLILTALSTESLLPTIVSRCEVISLRSLPVTKLVDHLLSQGEDEGRAQMLAVLAGGRPGYALDFSKNPERLERRTRFLDEMQELIGVGRLERFAYVEAWSERLKRKFPSPEDQRKECIDVLELWLGDWRDVMLTAYDVHQSISNPDRRSEIRNLSDHIPEDQIVRAVNAFQETITAIDNNANLRLALETLMLDFPRADFPLIQS
ncbi:MAG: DNA polymerase III subunit delta' [Chloroflexi bacterium RBG_16_48_8]|nr:MAG: DNA polymerase III subunit delta' [Chloroflexi bacterium RBG_16_48_8]